VTRRTVTAANTLLALIIFTIFALHLRLLWDTDSYLHPAIARHYRLHGIFDPPPWGRFSMTSWGGDKDLLFHVALIPFTIGDPATGARLGLAALNALLVGVLTWVFARGEGWPALVLPWWLYLTANPFFTRTVRLRPDIASLILLLLACEAAARKRWIWCGVFAAIYTLTYTPFHLMIGLAVVWLLVDRYDSGRWEWRIPAWMWGGVALGLVVRPHPIENFKLWYAQNVTFYSLVGKLDIGQEVEPPRLLVVLPIIAGWLIGMIGLYLASRRTGVATGFSPSRWEWLVYAATLAVFFVLYVRMNKMSIYFYPLAVATLLRWRASQGRRLMWWAAPALLLSVAAALPTLAHPTLLGILGLRGDVATETDLEHFGQAMPPGARVAATWSDAEMYVFWAPQGRYLNIYDSTFMYIPYPKLWEAQQAMFDGKLPDIPSTMRGPLQSDYIAFDGTGTPPDFVDRVRNDPRLRVVYGGYNVLLGYNASGENAFVRDWNGAHHNAYVTGCQAFATEVTGPQRFEFAPWDRATLAMDGVQRVEVRRPLHAVLGRGARIDVPPGPHRIEVRTCGGFYLVKKGSGL